MLEKSRRACRPDAQPFDEVRIKTVPRYKTSGLSGDEWRISATVEIYRKGRLLHEASFSNMDYATRLLCAEYVKASEGGKQFYGGEDGFCDQEGCAAAPTVTYALKKEFCRSGHGEPVSGQVVRMFCDAHKQRGDCGLEDADVNYTAISPT
jgi:hypothetical protein